MRITIKQRNLREVKCGDCCNRNTSQSKNAIKECEGLVFRSNYNMIATDDRLKEPLRIVTMESMLFILSHYFAFTNQLIARSEIENENNASLKNKCWELSSTLLMISN